LAVGEEKAGILVACGSSEGQAMTQHQSSEFQNKKGRARLVFRARFPGGKANDRSC
jgi:hypothetical protein